MTHYSNKDWKAYINEELPEHQYKLLEEHLYACDICLQVYMEVVEDNEVDLPILEDSSALASKVLGNLELETVRKKKEEKRPPTKLYEKVWFQYSIAAAATLLLMFSGVFQQLTGVVNTIENSNQPKASITKNIMDRTLSVLEKEKKERK
jgi:predicted anti-sigma-YlaC factor YlaD